MRGALVVACLLTLFAAPTATLAGDPPAPAAVVPPAAEAPAVVPELLLEKRELRVRLAPAGPTLPLTLPGLTPPAPDSPTDFADLASLAEEGGELRLALFRGPEPGVWFVAVAGTYEGAMHMDHVSRDGRLWRLRLPAAGAPARAPLAAELVRTEPDADFSAGTNRPGDATRLYSGATGLSELDLRTLKTTRIVRVPRPADAEDEEACALLDIEPRASADGRLVWFTRGGFCGYEGDFEGQRLVLDVASGRLRAARPVATVAVGPDGTVWYGDAAPDDDPWAGSSHAGWLFRAADGATTFRHVTVQVRGEEGPQVAETAVATVLVDPGDPQRLVVRTARASDDARGEWGGNVYESRDAGASWSRVLPPLSDEERDSAESEGLLVSDVVAPDGPLDHLVLRRERAAAWVRRGTAWTKVAPDVAPRPAPPAAAVRPEALGVEAVYQVAVHPRAAATIFAATSDGLYRSLDAGKTWARIARGAGVRAPRP